MDSPRLAYICFDVVPAPKGASTHIEAFTQTLASQVGNLYLITVSPTSEVIHDSNRWPGVTHIAFPALGKTLIDRVLSFRQQLGHWLDGQQFDCIHIRSIYEGFPIAFNKQQWCKFLIFEVNGLPSIELKYRYPHVADDRELMQKLLIQEQQCLDVADLILTPSHVTQAYLITRHVPANKIRVIPNGVDLATFSYHAPSSEPELSPMRWLYFGTLSAWQGIAIAIDALSLYSRDYAANLTVIGSGRPSQITALQKLASKLGVVDRLHLLDPLPQAELASYLHQADVIVAPLTANDRNLVQGCCPLKVLEGMASGTPVITSDLPVVNELGDNGVHFLAVKPGSAKAIKDAMLLLRNNPPLRHRLASAARQHIEHYYTWNKAGNALVNAYTALWNEELPF